MQLGEKISVDAVVDERHEEDTCVFCKATSSPVSIENDLEADPEGDDEAETGDEVATYKFKNDAGKLGRALGGRPEARNITLHDQVCLSSVAAHHLIPGNAAMKKSELYKSGEYLWKQGMAKGNIGYNINNELNGVWSPGNYAQRPWGKKGCGFENAINRQSAANTPKITAKDYAFASIDEWQCQFHDAHEKYSTFVIEVLDKLYEKLEAMEAIICPEAKKRDKDPEKNAPLYALLNRLQTISLRMKKMLVFPTTNWKPNIYTSRFVEDYMKEREHQERRNDDELENKTKEN